MFTLQKATVAQIIRWASEHPTIEVCGLVWATQGGAQTVWPLRNIHSDPARYYRTAPKDVREAFREMDLAGGEPLAWYHSHPGGKPDPSEADMQSAMNVGTHYLIAHPCRTDMGGADCWHLTAWECLSPQVLVGVDYEVHG